MDLQVGIAGQRRRKYGQVRGICIKGHPHNQKVQAAKGYFTKHLRKLGGGVKKQGCGH